MKKGQEEAPIELLIGVTVLTFVLIIGVYIFYNATEQHYEQKLRASFSKFARDIELVYMGSVGTSQITRVDFSSTGSSVNVQSIRIVRAPESTCLVNLGVESCLEIVAVLSPLQGTSSSENIFMIEVLSVPGDIDVINTFDGCDENLADFDILDSDGISDCWFRTTAYAIRIKKTAPGVIELGPVG